MKHHEKILFLDIEKSPATVYSYGIRDQYISHEQIKEESQIISFCAKWKHGKRLIYADQSKNERVGLDSKLLKKLWDLMDKADVIVAHNGDNFDIKQIKAAMIDAGMKPPSHFRTIDTLKMARQAGFASHKLDYLTKKLNKRYQKQDHGEFPGMKLGIACLLGIKRAWKCNREYNIYDVLSLEELYDILAPWGGSKVVLHPIGNEKTCACGSTDVIKNGYKYTNGGKFQKYICNECGRHYQAGKNLIKKKDKEKILK